MSWRRALGVGLAVAVYAVLSHWLITVDPSQPWLIAAPMLPFFFVTLLLAWRRRNAGLAWFSALALAAFIGVAWWGRAADVGRLFLAQHAGIHLLLGISFGVTLRRGATPLITLMARAVHGDVAPAMAQYTRRLTGVWALYFVLMAGLSLALYAWAPWHAWSFFANVITPLSVAGFFALEYALRYRLHPEFERMSWQHGVQAYRRIMARRAET